MRAWAIALVVVAAAGCRRGPSHDDCARLFDHFLDVEGDAATAGHFTDMPAPLSRALDGGKQTFRQRLAGGFIDLCTSELSRGEVDCALSATSEAGMDDCEQR